MLRWGVTGSQYGSRTIPSRAYSVGLWHEKSRLRESDRDRISFRKRTQAAPVTRMGDLRKHLPALAEHLPDVSIHLLHVEESLPMVGSVPASLVGERLDLHSNPSPEYVPRNRTSRFSLRSELAGCTKGSTRFSPSHNPACQGPCARRRKQEPASLERRNPRKVLSTHPLEMLKGLGESVLTAVRWPGQQSQRQRPQPRFSGRSCRSDGPAILEESPAECQHKCARFPCPHSHVGRYSHTSSVILMI